MNSILNVKKVNKSKWGEWIGLAKDDVYTLKVIMEAVPVLIEQHEAYVKISELTLKFQSKIIEHGQEGRNDSGTTGNHTGPGV